MNIIKRIINLFQPSYTRSIAPCGTVVDKLPTVVEVPEGKEMAKFNPKTGKLYWPSDGSYAEHPGMRDIPNKTK